MSIKPRDSAYLWDMLDAAGAVVSFVGSKTLDDYLKDPMLQAAVERKIEIIGVAAGKISEEFRQTHDHIPWRRIIGLRNVLAHDYGGVDSLALWKVVRINIPELINMLKPLTPPIPD